MENVVSLLEDSQIYGLIYPSQSLISDRLFEEISRKNEDFGPEKFLFREQNGHVKTHESSEVTKIDRFLVKENPETDLEKSVLYHANRKKSTGYDLKYGISQTELNIKLNLDLTELEKKFPVTPGTREELLQNIINRHGKKIEDNQLGKGLNALKQVLKSPISTPIEGVKRTEKVYALHRKAKDENLSKSEQNSFSITEEYSSAKYFKNILSEKMSEQFSRHIEGIPASKRFLEEKSGKITESSLPESNFTVSNLIEPNQRSEASFADYHTHNLKSLDSEKQLIEKKEFSVNSKRINNQFSRHIQGNSTSKRFLEEKSGNASGQNPSFSTDSTKYNGKDNSKDFKSKSNQLLERVREQFNREQFDRKQFNRTSLLYSKILENERKPEILPLTNINLLIEEAYSNSIKKSDLKEENRELLLNLIENISQVMNPKNRDTAPSKQNIFNIHVSGESLTGEKDLKDLSDRLVLILKDQARRHGIDLS